MTEGRRVGPALTMKVMRSRATDKDATSIPCIVSQAGKYASAFANTDIKNTDARSTAGRASTLDVTFVLFLSISLSLDINMCARVRVCSCVYIRILKLPPLFPSADCPINPADQSAGDFSRRKLAQMRRRDFLSP